MATVTEGDIDKIALKMYSCKVKADKGGEQILFGGGTMWNLLEEIEDV